MYSTANGAPVADEGKKYLQGKTCADGPNVCVPVRVGKVTRPLLAVAGMVDKSHTVVFDSAGSYAVNKKTGQRISFKRHPGGWNMDMTLEAPDGANIACQQQLAELKSADETERFEVVIVEKSKAELEEDAKDKWCQVGPFGRPVRRP
jgi:hypothetical protein